MNDSTVPAHQDLPADHPAHANLSMFLKLLFLLAPLIVAPYVKSPAAKAILEAETPIAQAVSQAIPE